MIFTFHGTCHYVSLMAVMALLSDIHIMTRRLQALGKWTNDNDDVINDDKYFLEINFLAYATGKGKMSLYITQIWMFLTGVDHDCTVQVTGCFVREV